MGNSYSVALVREVPDPAWNSYCTEEWRSERARELDRLGGKYPVQVKHTHVLRSSEVHPNTLLLPVCPITGLNRPPIKRGGSFNAKLQFLAVRPGFVLS